MSSDLPTVIHHTEDELREQRAALLAHTGLTYTELRDRAAVWTLTPEQHDAWSTVCGIDYLLTGRTTPNPAPDAQ